jgi:hypothetical protein
MVEEPLFAGRSLQGRMANSEGLTTNEQKAKSKKQKAKSKDRKSTTCYF